MFRQFALSLTLSCTCLILVSCATFKDQAVEEINPTREPAGWMAEQKLRQQINIWEIRGRLGVQTKTDGGVMDIIWKQSADEFSIRLLAPLGAGNYLIQGDAASAEIRFPDGHKKITNNIDDIFYSTLEVELPVSAIKDWIRGVPAKSLPIDEIHWNEKQLLHSLKQSGWNVEMTKYAGAKIKMPHTIYLSRDDDEELDIRLILRQWLLDN